MVQKVFLKGLVYIDPQTFSTYSKDRTLLAVSEIIFFLSYLFRGCLH